MSDPGADEDDLIELIREKGECVCSVYWNANRGYSIGPDAPLEAYAAIAPEHPVFRVVE